MMCRSVVPWQVMARGKVVSVIHVMSIIAVPLVVGEMGTAVSVAAVPVSVILAPSLAAPPAAVPVVTSPPATVP
jgi:hypothetical protein